MYSKFMFITYYKSLVKWNILWIHIYFHLYLYLYIYVSITFVILTDSSYLLHQQFRFLLFVVVVVFVFGFIRRGYYTKILEAFYNRKGVIFQTEWQELCRTHERRYWKCLVFIHSFNKHYWVPTIFQDLC